MKKEIDYLNGLNFKDTTNFKRNVLKTLPTQVEQIYLSSVQMKRLGSGHYCYSLHLEINKEELCFTENTHSSPAWDYWQNLEAGSVAYTNWCKQTVLMLLENF